MKLGRRGFFRMLGGAAAIAIAPKPLLALIPETAAKYIKCTEIPTASLTVLYNKEFQKFLYANLNKLKMCQSVKAAA
jgi:hypothetical protein